ncbi:flagellar biosynthesis protein FlhF [Candidatus Aerophobetes bacterium]|nr:flagellar biosynthesis protein FlhF [Candidatus Aerophobetes bacterium]
MKIKKYTAPNMWQALNQIKEELGPEALILQTKDIKEKGVPGIFKKRRVEVVAAVDEESYKVSESPWIEDLKNQLNRIDKNIRYFYKQTKYKDLSYLTTAGQKIYAHLLQQGVKKEIAQQLMKKMSNEINQEKINESTFIIDYLTAQMRGMMRTSGPIQLNLNEKHPKVVALVGPTGVGKTTTLAKLAAQFKIYENKKVALITLDTYRMGAVEQLKSYAQIMTLPLTVALTPQELKEALYKYRDKDLILIDTSGRSQFDKTHLFELKGFLQIIKSEIEVHLLLSLNNKLVDMLEMIKRFQILSPSSLLITKLDETMYYGDILNIAAEANEPFSYITTGQNVPEDIEVADVCKLSQLILDPANCFRI